MATAAPFVKLLRQLSSAKDEYRSGALDITWDGTKATLFFVFGQPNHATYESEGETTLEGQEALAALLHNLPRKFTVATWRKAVVRNETLKMTVDELMEPFAQLAGAHAPEEEPPAEAPALAPHNDAFDIGTGFAAEFDFGLEDFPMLPLGESMWSDAAVNVVHLDLLIPKLPTALIILTGPKLRAAALTLNGQLIDAVWVDAQERAAGEGAAMALMGAREGTVSCYRIDMPKLVEALTMLWRCPARYRDLNVQWFDPDRFIDTLRREQRDCVVRIDGPISAVGFFMNGEFIACYSSEDRIPSASLDTIRELLRTGEGTVTIQQRAGDKALGRGPGEEAFHAYVAPSAAPGATVPSYADGAAALGGDELAPPVAAEEASPWTAPVTSEAEAEASIPAAEAAATAEEPQHEVPAAFAATPPPAAEEVVHEAPVADDGADVAADFFGVSPEELASATPPPTPAEKPAWFAGDNEEAPAPAGEAAPAEATAAATPSWSARDAEEETSALDSWNASPPAEAHATEESNVVAGGFGEIPSSEHPADAAPPPDAADSPFYFGLSTATENGAAAEPVAAPPVVENDGSYESPRIDLDFETIKQDLIQIGVLWLGSDDVAPVADLIRNTKPSVDDFVSTIDAIKGIAVTGHDPSVIRAMAREMHYHAAEYLSGA